MIGLIENTGGSENKLPHMPKGYLLALVDNIFKRAVTYKLRCSSIIAQNKRLWQLQLPLRSSLTNR